ncbi:hypothetical protein RvY_08880 [Ramazzottius varieornatus]|uniref:Transmembrane protein 45B n=1 Tax=Ramazzottius varieornatus TaxID=947166 RepID=A0A1D1V7D7_RAMVA|nr:hypothetical protein RvY_08880 [Ramazzottius varieornatus]
MFLRFERTSRSTIGSRKRTGFISFTSFGPSGFRRFPLIPVLKVLLTAVGIAGETVTAMRDGKFQAIGNTQHIAMYTAFCVHGLSEIFVFYRSAVATPLRLEYVSLAMAFFVEGILFQFHLHGRPMMDVHLHTFLYYVVYGCAVFAAVEIKFRSSILVPTVRCSLTFLQGIWFWFIAFVLHSPWPGISNWNQEDHNDNMLVTAMFGFAICFTFVTTTVIAFVAYCWSK